MNWSRKSNRGSPQCGAFAVGSLVGAPGVGGMTPGLYRCALAAEAPLPRASLCLRTVFRGSAGAFARLLIGRGDVFALCRIRGGGRNPLGQRQVLRFA